MQSFEVLAEQFSKFFSRRHFPAQPASLYDPNEYFLHQGGKRIRPVLCLMGNEMFDDIKVDAWHVGTSIELFHNFTLIHDDIMDKAPVRRGKETVHEKFGTNTAILAGDVMLVSAYEELNKIGLEFLRPILTLFNKTAKEVCEGQQMDMDFEKREDTTVEEYLQMITLKTSVLLGCSAFIGATLAGASETDSELLYDFGKNLGICFQLQDDFLDAFGNPHLTGKKAGGDIVRNKKTFLFISLISQLQNEKKIVLNNILQEPDDDKKIQQVLHLYEEYRIQQHSQKMIDAYFQKALTSFDNVSVEESRKLHLRELAHTLYQRSF